MNRLASLLEIFFIDTLGFFNRTDTASVASFQSLPFSLTAIPNICFANMPSIQVNIVVSVYPMTAKMLYFFSC